MKSSWKSIFSDWTLPLHRRTDYEQIAKRYLLLKYSPLQCVKKDMIFQSGQTVHGFIVRGAWGVLLYMCFGKAGYNSDTIWFLERINIPPETLVWSGTEMSWGRISQLALLPFPNVSVAHPPVQSLGRHNAPVCQENLQLPSQGCFLQSFLYSRIVDAIMWPRMLIL